LSELIMTTAGNYLMSKSESDQRRVPPDPSRENAAEVPSARQNMSPRQWSSRQLLGVHREVMITHGEDVYRLRVTRNGKLILHK